MQALVITIFILSLIIGHGSAGTWSRLKLWASDVSTKSNEMLFLGKQGVAYGFGNKPIGNPRVDRNFSTISAAADGWYWATNQSNNTFRWNPTNQNWDLLPGIMERINAASGKLAIGILNGTAYQWDDNATVWRALPKPTGVNVVRAAIGVDGDHWILTSNTNGDNIYRYSHGWKRISGRATEIDVNDRNTIVVTASDGSVWTWSGDGWSAFTSGTTKASMNDAAVFAIGDWNDLWICLDLQKSCG